MERQNRTFTTPSGITVEIRETLTGREVTSLEDIQLRHMEMGMSTVEGAKGMERQADVRKFDAASAVRQKENKLLEYAIVSVDGNTEKVLDLVLDLPANDYKAVLKEAEALLVVPNQAK